MRALTLILLTCLSLSLGCGESDADRIDTFVEAVTGELSEQRVQQVLTTYVALEQQPLDVVALGERRLYTETERERFEADAARKLPRVYGKTLRVLRRQIELKGSNAYVELQLLGEGLTNVSYELHKHGERWLLAELRLQ